MAADVLGGLASSRLDNALVRDKKTAVACRAGVEHARARRRVQVDATVQAGRRSGAGRQQLDAVIAEFIKNGPTADELKRAKTERRRRRRSRASSRSAASAARR